MVLTAMERLYHRCRLYHRGAVRGITRRPGRRAGAGATLGGMDARKSPAAAGFAASMPEPTREQARPVLAAIARGDVAALDAWLAPKGPVRPTTLILEPSMGRWAICEVVRAIGQCPDPAARAGLLARMVPVLSIRTKGWASGWVASLPDAMAGPPDVVECFQAHGAGWHTRLPGGTPAWMVLPAMAGERAAAYLERAHAATGPWSPGDMAQALERAVVANNPGAVRVLLRLGADPRQVAPHPLHAAPRMRLLEMAVKSGFQAYREIFRAFWERGAFRITGSPEDGALHHALGQWRCGKTGQPLLGLLEKAQAQWAGQRLGQRLDQALPAAPNAPAPPRL